MDKNDSGIVAEQWLNNCAANDNKGRIICLGFKNLKYTSYLRN